MMALPLLIVLDWVGPSKFRFFDVAASLTAGQQRAGNGRGGKGQGVHRFSGFP